MPGFPILSLSFILYPYPLSGILHYPSKVVNTFDNNNIREKDATAINQWLNSLEQLIASCLGCEQ